MVNNLLNNEKEFNNVYTAVNTEMMSLYWNIGKIIMEIQGGE